MFWNICLFCLIAYICRVILSPFIIYPLAFIQEWNKLWWACNKWWFYKGTTIKDILENIKEQEFNDMFRDLYWIPLFGFCSFIFYFFYLVILMIIFTIGLIFRLTIMLIIGPIVIYIILPVYHKIYQAIKFSRLPNMYLYIESLLDKIRQKMLKIKIS